MLSPIQGFTYNKFEKSNDWPKIDKTFDYKIENGKLLSGNEHIYLSGPITYTKVGNPTITDGIASGFSTDGYNYIKSSSDVRFDLVTEIVVKVKLSDLTTSNKSIINFGAGFTINTYNNTFYINVGENYWTGGPSNFFVSNTWRWIKWQYNNGIAVASISEDGINYTQIKQAETSIQAVSRYFYCGQLSYNQSTGFTCGSIDLNNTYIKVNDQLWFYGKNYTTSNIVPVPAGLEYNNTTTPSIGWVDTDTSSSNFQQFTPAPEGTMIGKDETEMLKVETYQEKGQVDYNVVGTPIITDGIVSGFTDSNYITNAYPTTIPAKTECIINFTTGNTITGSSNQSILNFVDFLNIEINTSGQLYTYDYTARQRVGNVNLATNTNYYCKILFENGQKTFSLSTDGVNYTTFANFNDTTYVSLSGAVYYGKHPTNANRFFKGSINLNNTYIKINGLYWFKPYPTMYSKIVGPVDYTTVGSPTITNGIVSNFSQNDYPSINSSINIKNITETMFRLYIDTTNMSDNQNFFLLQDGTRVQYFFNRYLTNGVNMSIRVAGANHVSPSRNVPIDTWFYLKTTYDGTTYKAFKSSDKITWEQIMSFDVDLSSEGDSPSIRIGSYSYNASNYFYGYVDLNETYIKVNGCMWFGKEDWNPSIYSDNSIYLLSSHSSNYSSYNNLGFTPTISNNGTYNLWIDNQEIFSEIEGRCDIVWQDLALPTGYSITNPESLKAHIIKIEPTDKSNIITAYRCNRLASSGTENQGILQAIFNLDNEINIQRAFADPSSVKNLIMKSIDAKGNCITTNNISYTCYDNSGIVHFPKLKVTTNSVSSPFHKTNEHYLNLDILDSSSLSFLNCYSLEKIDSKNTFNSLSRQFENNNKLKQFPKINLNQSVNNDLSKLLVNDLYLKPTNLDLSQNINLKSLGIYGNSTHRIDGLKSVIVSNQAPFDSSSSPQIDVSYTGLDKTALVNLFNSLPTVSNGQSIKISGCIGTNDLTDDDKSIAISKGWNLIL